MPRPSIILLVLVSLAGAGALSALGFWQIERLQWKEALLARIAERLSTEPRPLPPSSEWRDLASEEHEYERFIVSGVLEPREALIWRSSGKVAGALAQPGYWVMVPLRLADGARVLINRGFVALDKKDDRRIEALKAEPVTVAGILRLPEPRGYFTPADNPSKGEWFTRDPQAIASTMKLERVAAFSLDEEAFDAPRGMPAGGATIIEIPNNHFAYAMTWFGLAATLLAVALAFSIRNEEA